MRVLSQYCANPSHICCNLVIQIFRYLTEILELGITFKSDEADELIGYMDSDCAGLQDRQKSTGEYVFLLLGGPIFHQSKHQATSALSSTEVEYIATTEVRKEALWVVQFLATLGYRLSG